MKGDRVRVHTGTIDSGPLNNFAVGKTYKVVEIDIEQGQMLYNHDVRGYVQNKIVFVTFEEV
jgi:hypothetical protein